MSRFHRFTLKFVPHDSSPTRQLYIPPKEEQSLLHICWQVIKDPFRFWFKDWIIWRINTSYLNFFMQSCVCFFIWCYVFAAFIYLIIDATYSRNGVECAHSADSWQYDQATLSHRRHNMEIAFEMSWITFTTVGYGNVSPTGYNSGCYGLRFFCAFEAFVGLVFFSLMGAVFFAKIGHTFTEAPITFSGAVCLQHDSYMPSSDKYPYLEFQIVHNKANYEGWEILGATMECIVVIDVPAGARFDYHVRGSELFALDFHKGNSSIVKQTYHKVSLEGSTHPYFKRVWHCRHILDENSPLLKKSIKEEIRNNNGWPSGRLSHNGIRNVLLPFNTLLLTMNGKSGKTSTDVFAEKRYSFEDVYIGWEFAGVLYLRDRSRKRKHKAEKKVMVDMTLIHDITPQDGGISETLELKSTHNLRKGKTIQV